MWVEVDQRDAVLGTEHDPVQMEKADECSGGMAERKRRDRAKAEGKMKDCFAFGGGGSSSESEVELQDRQRQYDHWSLKRPATMEHHSDVGKQQRNT